MHVCVCVCVCVPDYINPSTRLAAIVAAVMVIQEQQRLNLHESKDKITLYFQVCFPVAVVLL